MKLGIISEGTTELAVIENILIGLGIDNSDVLYIRPDLNYDETDLASQNQKTIGTWQGVKNSCLRMTDITQFLSIEGNEFVVIQIDTAECGDTDFGITRPSKSLDDYTTQFRDLIVCKINSWLSNNYQENIIHAVCIEEIEAWILTIYSKTGKDTSLSADPKAKLSYILGKLNTSMKFCSNNFDYASRLTKDFRNKNKLKICANNNSSLSAFIEDIKSKVLINYKVD